MMLNEIRSGQRFKWVGLPGQYSMDGAQIEVDSMTASCRINARILRAGDEPALISIRAADFAAALGAGWLILVSS
jgi:hypothetical protein